MSKTYYETAAESVKSTNTVLTFELVEQDRKLRMRYPKEALGTVEKYYVDGKQRLIPVPTSDPLGKEAFQIL